MFVLEEFVETNFL